MPDSVLVRREQARFEAPLSVRHEAGAGAEQLTEKIERMECDVCAIVYVF